MRRRGWIGLVIVLAVTGSAVATHLVSGQGGGSDPESRDVSIVAQHTRFVELVVQEKAQENQSHRFSAVAGITAKHVKQTNVISSAVLWFQDQFLFGSLDNRTSHPAPGGSIAKFAMPGCDPCFVVEGFVIAIGSDDPYGTGLLNPVDQEVNNSDPSSTHGTPPIPRFNNIAIAKRTIDLDNACGGCLIEYVGTLFITDPNGITWVVDKLVYPVSFSHLTETVGLSSPSEDNHCRDGATEQDDPTIIHVGNGTHVGQGECAEQHSHRAEDDGSAPEEERHCFDAPNGSECDGDQSDPTDSPGRNRTKFTLKEPMYVVRGQVDPDADADGEPLVDQAPWRTDDGTIRDGLPLRQDTDPGTPGDQESEQSAFYNFLIVVDFEAFDDLLPGIGPDGTIEDELIRNGHHHGDGAADDDRPSAEGNSHPHDPTEVQSGPQHRHDLVVLDLFAYDSAPYFTEQNAYWDGAGAPPAWNDFCQVANPSTPQDAAINARVPIVCDTTGGSTFK